VSEPDDAGPPRAAGAPDPAGDRGGTGAPDANGANGANDANDANDAPDGASASDATDPQRKRRRRRGRGRGERPEGAPVAPPTSATSPLADDILIGDPYAAGALPPAPMPAQPAPRDTNDRGRRRRGGGGGGGGGDDRGPQPRGAGQPQGPRSAGQPQGPRSEGPQRPRGDKAQPRSGGQPPAARGDGRARRGDPARRGPDSQQQQRGRGPREGLPPVDRDEPAPSEVARADALPTPPPASSVGGAMRTNQSVRQHLATPDDDEEAAPVPTEAWGTDDGGPAPAITLTSSLPADPPATDLDPTTAHLLDEAGARLGEDVASLVGVRFVPAGRVQWFDASDVDYVPGERVICDYDRGNRLGWIATIPVRRSIRDRNLRRVIRRANEQDLRGEQAGDEHRISALRLAKDKAAALRLPLKVFRVETSPGKLRVYYTSDDRLDLRDFVRELAQATGTRPELRQLGVRDEAKAVGGIGSCGLTLCCTTWLPEFVPVSIKMAKDQGLVLSPTKVSGQCGRLKCCLVYEQAAYAELRKGLPKLGKRVIGARGEGRIVEVDVLRQRLRVSYGPGDSEVVPAAEVTPLFPAGNQPRQGGAPAHGEHADHADHADHDDPDPSADPSAQDDDPTDDPSALP
jgi:cell fate regulator YaaT (PSP1 superfamily)